MQCAAAPGQGLPAFFHMTALPLWLFWSGEKIVPQINLHPCHGCLITAFAHIQTIVKDC
jgi:hypothetical protein